jgi:hypothetical protein
VKFYGRKKKSIKDEFHKLFGKKAEMVHVTAAMPRDSKEEPVIYLTLADHRGGPLHSRVMSMEEAANLSAVLDHAISNLNGLKHQGIVLAKPGDIQ